MKTKTYITKHQPRTIKAKLFEKGDEDGCVIRYTDSKKNIDGYVPTYPTRGKGMKAVKIPYILWSKDQHKCLSKGFGKEYLTIDENGEKGFSSKRDFNKYYTPKLPNLTRKEKKKQILKIFDSFRNNAHGCVHQTDWGLVAESIIETSKNWK